LSLTSQGKIRYELKTPYRDGTTHVIFEPVEFIARLAAPVANLGFNLTRLHGVFVPNSKHRVWVAGFSKPDRKAAKNLPTPTAR